MAEDAHQQVVEVVGDAAGQHAQALELLRLLNLRQELQALVFGPAAFARVPQDQRQELLLLHRALRKRGLERKFFTRGPKPAELPHRADAAAGQA